MKKFHKIIISICFMSFLMIQAPPQISAKEEDIRKLADLVEAVLAQENICVIGNEEKIKEEQELFLSTKDLF